MLMAKRTSYITHKGMSMGDGCFIDVTMNKYETVIKAIKTQTAG